MQGVTGVLSPTSELMSGLCGPFEERLARGQVFPKKLFPPGDAWLKCCWLPKGTGGLSHLSPSHLRAKVDDTCRKMQ